MSDLPQISLSEVRRMILRAYHDEALRDKFDIVLRTNRPPKEVPVECWKERLLFSEQYFRWKATDHWCEYCKIRKYAHEKTNYCFLCIGRQDGRSPKFQCRCEYFFDSIGSAPPELNPFPEMDLPGSQCRNEAIDGKYCRLHMRCVDLTAEFLRKNPLKLSEQAQAERIKTPEWTARQLRERFPMSRFYSGALSSELQQYVKDCCGMEAAEIFDVREELSIARAAVAPVIAKFSEMMKYKETWEPQLKTLEAALEVKEKDGTINEKEKKQLVELKIKLKLLDNNINNTSDILLRRMEQMMTLADRASMIYNRHANVIDTNALNRVIQNVIHLVGESVGPEEIQRIEMHIRKSINLPSAGAPMPTVNPDEMVQNMIRSMGLEYHEDDPYAQAKRPVVPATITMQNGSPNP